MTRYSIEPRTRKYVKRYGFLSFARNLSNKYGEQLLDDATKMTKLLHDSTVSNFETRKWIEVNDLSGSEYSVNKKIRFKTPVLRSHLCDYSDEYIVLKWKITVEGANASNKTDKMLDFKNNALFRSCISKSNNRFIDNARYIDIIITM